MKNRLLILFVFCTVGSWSQSNLSLEFVGLTIHPLGDKTANLQPYKLDEKARFVLNFGGVLTYEKYVFSDIIALKGMQAIAADCSAGWASISSFGIKAAVIRKPKHRFGFSLGPAFIMRESWHRFEDYVPSGSLNEANTKILGEIQYKFFPIAAELEYEYSFTDNLDFTASVTPGIPLAVTWAFGMKYWFNKDFVHKKHLPKIKK